MLDALISGKLIKTPKLKTGQSGKHYTQFLLSVSTGEENPVVISGMSFGEIVERIALLQKGDALAVVGALKPTEWTDKVTNIVKHGLSVTVSNSLSPYNIQKRCKLKPDNATNQSDNGSDPHPFDDVLLF